ncbi:12705_t:CDS:2 [Funneliformis caledonium]|uniref:12705_t:CDS:1 n=1 Tax=Funneliformis caledonium TaxID=1117310 RepID=A0A9N9B9Z3_9GLOM|nr:12705_t:CDS:2 [Funneliformis caledonium]
MTPSLPTDCLNGIFRCLLDDASSLHSCLLVNRLWCEIAIPLLWNNPWQSTQLFVDRNWPAIIRTFSSCLPEESKDILRRNGIDLLQTISSKPPLFDYVGYCQYLSPTVMDRLKRILTVGEDNKKNVNEFYSRLYREHLVEQEFYKLFMSRCSLKHLVLPRIPLSYFPGANHCLEYLRHLKCYIDRPPELFYGLAHISRNLHRLTICHCDEDNEGLVTLIKLQKGLKSLVLDSSEDYVSICPRIGQALITQAHSLSFLKIRQSLCIPPETIAFFINLRILQLDITTRVANMELLSLTTLPKLEILDIFGDENAPFKIKHFIQILLPASSTLRFLTIWWSEETQKELFTLLSLCRQLEAIKFCYQDLNSNSNSDEYYLADESCTGNFVQGKLIFELLELISHGNENLCILCLQGKWTFTSKELIEFLEFWKEKQKNSLSLYLLPFESKSRIELDRIFQKYLTSGVLKDFGDKGYLDTIPFLRNIWTF